MLLRDTILFLSRRFELEEFLRSNPLAKQARDSFIAGESRQQALAVASTLNEAGYKVTFDYLAKDPQDPDEAELTSQEFQGLLQELTELKLQAGISVKLNHLGLRLDQAMALRHLSAVAATAADCNRFIRVDMQEPDTVDSTLALVYQLAPKAANIGTVVQAYLRRSEADIEALNARKIPVQIGRASWRENLYIWVVGG